jgi:excisionase family DNA binding protein
METLTITEAAEATGLSKKAVRNRVDRGQVRAVLRDGVRRIPRSELERVGLAIKLPHEAGGGAITTLRNAAESRPDEAGAWKEALERLERQAAELAELRLITRQAESLREELDRLEVIVHQERAERQSAEARLQELDQAREDMAGKLDQLRSASFFARRRLLRELRTVS